MKKIFLLFVSVLTAFTMSAQTYTIVSQNNEDTIKLFSNTIGKAIKNMVPGAKEEVPRYFLIKKEYEGKESLLFVEASTDEKKIFTSYETDLITPNSWNVQIYTLYDIYTQLKYENAILLRGKIIGIPVEMYLRPANFHDIINVDGFEFPSPTKITVLDETRKLAEEELEKQRRQADSSEIGLEQSRKETIPADAFKNIDKEDIIEAQKMSNDCYVAFLIKTNDFNQSASRDVLDELCDSEHIKRLISKYDTILLKDCGKYHDKRLNKYIKW